MVILSAVSVRIRKTVLLMNSFTERSFSMGRFDGSFRVWDIAWQLDMFKPDVSVHEANIPCDILKKSRNICGDVDIDVLRDKIAEYLETHFGLMALDFEIDTDKIESICHIAEGKVVV